VFGLVGLCYAASGTYFISTISTIEKRFKIPSRTSGNYSWSLHMTSSSNKIFIKELSGFRCCGLHRLNHLHQNHLNNYSLNHLHQNYLNNYSLNHLHQNHLNNYSLNHLHQNYLNNYSLNHLHQNYLNNYSLNHLHQNHLNNYSVTHVAFNIHSAFITNFTPQTNKQTTRSRFQPHLQLYHIFPKKKLDACSSEKHGYRICPW